MPQRGRVKYYNADKGVGVITLEDGRDVLVQRRAIDARGFGSLQEGERVSLDVVDGPRGPEARNVESFGPPDGPGGRR
jgi:CspA family cold shock protein